MKLLSICGLAVLLPCAASAQTPSTRPKAVTKTLPGGETVVVNRLKITLREGSAKQRSLDAQGKAKAVPLAGLSALHPDIVEIKGGHTSSRAWLKGADLPQTVRKPGGIPRIARNFTAELRAGADVAAVRTALLRHPDVERVDYKTLCELHSVPNDAWYSRQWAPAITGLQEAWDVPGRGHVRVAVVDTGAKMNHTDLIGRVVFNNGYSDFETGEAPASGSGNDHGTHVAGIIAGTRNNGLGIAGYSNDIDLMILNCATWDEDKAKWLIGDSDDAIDDAVANGASVINCSFGFSDALQDEVEDAFAAGVLVVHSAGNDSSSIEGHWESSSDALFTVTATKLRSPAPAPPLPPIEDFDLDYSNYGNGVDIAAPGTGIYSTIIDGIGYGYKDGTSMAAPQVSGAAALMMSMNPSGLLGHRAVRHLLIRMAVDRGVTGYDSFYGHGVLRLDKATYQACRDATAFVNSASTVPAQTGAYDYPWKTLPAAIAVAPPNGNLVLNGGTTDAAVYQYPPITIWSPDKAVTLSAIPGRPVVIGGP